MTIPLGCLKAQHVSFKPALPTWKQEAIARLGYGTLNKVSRSPAQTAEQGHDINHHSSELHSQEGWNLNWSYSNHLTFLFLFSLMKRCIDALVQVILEFPEVFWEPQLSYFGAALPSEEAERGAGFMYWNLFPVTGRKQLIALMSGEAAYQGEDLPDEILKVGSFQCLSIKTRLSQAYAAILCIWLNFRIWQLT